MEDARYKGVRKQYTVRVPVELDLAALAKEAGYKVVGQYIADEVCKSQGRPDLVFGLPKGRRQLPDARDIDQRSA